MFFLTKAWNWKCKFWPKTWKIKPCIQTKNKCTNFSFSLNNIWIKFLNYFEWIINFHFSLLYMFSGQNFMCLDSKLFFYGFKSFFSVSDFWPRFCIGLQLRGTWNYQNQNGIYSPWKFAQTKNLLWQEGAYNKHMGTEEKKMWNIYTKDTQGT